MSSFSAKASRHFKLTELLHSFQASKSGLPHVECCFRHSNSMKQTRGTETHAERTLPNEDAGKHLFAIVMHDTRTNTQTHTHTETKAHHRHTHTHKLAQYCPESEANMRRTRSSPPGICRPAQWPNLSSRPPYTHAWLGALKPEGILSFWNSEPQRVYVCKKVFLMTMTVCASHRILPS